MIEIKGKGKPSGYAAKFIIVKRNKTLQFMSRSKTSEDLPFREACYHLTLSRCKAKVSSNLVYLEIRRKTAHRLADLRKHEVKEEYFPSITSNQQEPLNSSATFLF